MDRCQDAQAAHARAAGPPAGREPPPLCGQTLEGHFSPAVLNGCYREAMAAPDREWVLYDNAVERKRTCRALGALGPAWTHLGAVLTGSSFLGDLESLAGQAGLVADPDWYGAGCHVTDPGGFLGPHLDGRLFEVGGRLLERRLNVVVFLTPAWPESWGGAFTEYGADMAVTRRTWPKFGRVAVFDPSDPAREPAYHGTEKVKCPSGEARVTAVAFYYGPVRPGGSTHRRALFVPPRGH